jgi:mannose-1-phosphate guanylyltransferase
MSLHCNAPKDVNGNAALNGKTNFVESKNCVVNTRGLKNVVVIGMDNCIVAENGGNLLVCRMSDEGMIKEFSEEK